MLFDSPRISIANSETRHNLALDTLLEKFRLV